MSEVSTAVQPETEADAGGLWRNKDFLLFAFGVTISYLGDAFYGLVLPVLVLQATGSSTSMALVSVVGPLALVLLSPIAGTIADRTERRRMMIWADVARALVVMLFALVVGATSVQFWHVLLTAALMSIGSAFFNPAYSAAVTGLVPRQDLLRAISVFHVIRLVTEMAGPSIAGFVIGLAGDSTALWVDSLSYVASALCIYLLRFRWASRPPAEHRPFWQDFRVGISAIVGNPAVVRLVMMASGLNMAAGVFIVLQPVIALREFGLRTAHFGLFQAANPAGIVVGAALISLFSNRVQHKGRFILQNLLLMGLLNMVMGVAQNPLFFGGLLFVSGLVFGLVNVMFAAMFREVVPPEQQGRFFGLLGPLNRVLMPIGFAFGGFAGDYLTPFVGVAAAGAMVVTLAGLGLMTSGLRDVK